MEMEVALFNSICFLQRRKDGRKLGYGVSKVATAMLKSMMAALIFRAAELRSMEVLPIAFTMVSLPIPSCDLSFLRWRILSYFPSPHSLAPPTIAVPKRRRRGGHHGLSARACRFVLLRHVFHTTAQRLRFKL